MHKKRFPFVSKESSSQKSASVFGYKENKSIFSQKILFGIIFVLFVIIVVLSFFFYLKNEDYNSLKNEHASFTSSSDNTIFALNEKISLLEKNNSDLNKALVNLNNAYDILSSKSDQLEESYSVLQTEVEGTIQKIEEYKVEIQSSLDWFNYNSLLGKEGFSVLSKLKSNCKSENSRECKINLGCFNLVNSKFINYKYKDDLVTSSSFDKLQSVSDFVKNKGGDCEDFSLFFKAEYNSLVDSCDGKKPNLFAWVENKGSKFWSNFSETWYLPDAKAQYLDVNNIHPLVVCGSIFDPQSQQVNGHCVLAFASRKIISVEDIFVLEDSELIEPQTGQYLGFIGSDSGVFLVSLNSSSLSYIDTLITDNDFFIFRNNEWSNYKKFGSELFIDKNSLESLIN